MANTSQARKRARQAETRRAHNQKLRSRVRTAIKKVEKASASSDAAAARATFEAVVPEIDTMAGKGILNKNAAARYKHRLNQRIKRLSTPA
ncbi:MAG: 30S ribosomal protein S20 [Gammaproteobacteria bacterium]